MVDQFWKFGISPGVGAAWMNEAGGSGRNSPQLPRSLVMTWAMSRPSCADLPSAPARSGMAIGIGALRAWLTSITALWPPHRRLRRTGRRPGGGRLGLHRHARGQGHGSAGRAHQQGTAANSGAGEMDHGSVFQQ